MKRLLMALVATLVLGLAISGYAAEKIRFSVHIGNNPHYALPILAALDQGLWKKQGLEVEYTGFRSPRAQDDAVVAGSVQMGIIGLAGLTRGISAGVPYAWVADPMTTRFYVWVRPDGPVQVPGDLKGHSISITRFGADLHYATIAMGKALGIEKEMKIVATGGVPQRLAAMKSGATDGTTSPFCVILPMKIKGDVRQILAIDEYVPKGLFAQGIFARTELLKKNPDLVRKVTKGWLQGAKFIRENREWSVKKMTEKFRYTPEVARLCYPRLQFTDGKIDLKRIEAVRKFLVGSGIVPKDKMPPIGRIYAGDIVQ